MKNSICQTRILALALCTTLFGCEINQDLKPAENNVLLTKPLSKNESSLFLSEELKVNTEEKILAAACEEYSLVLAGASGTPHIAGLQSFLANVNIATGATTAASPIINISVATTPPITTMTGITKVQGSTLYGVTGMNSNFPNSLFKINAANGNATFVALTVSGMTTTAIALQDIERNPTNGRYYAIKEGTNQIWASNNAINWFLLAVTPSAVPLNGLTFRNNQLWVIAGGGAGLCGLNVGNMYSYTLAGALTGSTSYNAANPTWTNKELGLTFYNPGGCVPKNFVVGSAMNILSNNMNLCPMAPVFISQIKPTYDFAKP